MKPNVVLVLSVAVAPLFVGLSSCGTPTPAKVVASDAGRPVSNAPKATPLPEARLAIAGAQTFCVFREQRDVFCFHPERSSPKCKLEPSLERGIGEIASSKDVIDVSDHKCLLALSRDGTVRGPGRRCSGAEIARSIQSIEANPYLVRRDGSIEVVEEEPSTNDENDVTEAHFELVYREAAVREIPAVRRVVKSSTAVCALTTIGEVYCFPEPNPFGFARDEGFLLIRPKPKRVPGIDHVEDLFLQDPMTLCVRLANGSVRCSALSVSSFDACVLRGTSAIRCGRAAGSGTQLIGSGIDPTVRLEQPLPQEPVIEGANAMMPFHGMMYFSHSSLRVLALSGIDEGGCARVGSGVRCWERTPCGASSAWRTAQVEGLPPAIASLSLGAVRGYAITAEGELYAFPRRAEDTSNCPAPKSRLAIRAERMQLPGKVVMVLGRELTQLREPSFISFDCASLAGGAVWCWESTLEKTEPFPIPVPP
jgi:hypothetical protein